MQVSIIRRGPLTPRMATMERVSCDSAAKIEDSHEIFGGQVGASKFPRGCTRPRGSRVSTPSSRQISVASIEWVILQRRKEDALVSSYVSTILPICFLFLSVPSADLFLRLLRAIPRYPKASFADFREQIGRVYRALRTFYSICGSTVRQAADFQVCPPFR